MTAVLRTKRLKEQAHGLLMTVPELDAIACMIHTIDRLPDSTAARVCRELITAYDLLTRDGDSLD